LPENLLKFEWNILIKREKNKRIMRYIWLAEKGKRKNSEQ